jgi:hypothetical protein
MKYFTRLDNNNKVTEVISLEDNICSDYYGVFDESLGIAYCKKAYGVSTNWLQTSDENGFRGHFARVNDTYREDLDVFLIEKPFPSWVLDTNAKVWVSPIGDPPPVTAAEASADKSYVWDEDNTAWYLKST